MIIATFKNGTLIGFTKNHNKTLEELKAIKEVDGAVCYPITEEQHTQLSEGWDASVVDGQVVTSKGEAATQKEAEQKERHNNEILRQIGELNLIVEGKKSAELDASKEETQIETLKSQLL